MTDNNKQTFISLAFRQFKKNCLDFFGKANANRRSVHQRIDNLITGFNDWLKENLKVIVLVLALFIYLGLLAWFIIEWLSGKVQGSAVRTGVGGLIGAAIVGLIVSPICAFLVFLSLFVFNCLFKVITPVILFPPLIIWVVIGGGYQVCIVLLKFLLLIPLTVLVVVSRLIQLYRRIFHVCPYRGCSFRGYPIHLCPECGADNHYLWPNMYGLFKHECVNCGTLLPTLYHMGRKHLIKRCGICGMQLIGKHAGRIPVRQIGIIGGPASGKTNYLLMAVNQIMAGQNWINGNIDDPDQAREFANDWNRLEQGIPAAKTVEALQAFMLYSLVNRAKYQLYLYDSPGEDFTSISGMSVHQYFGMMEGFIMMVDPTIFCVGNAVEKNENLSRFYAVVQSALNRILQEKQGENSKINMRVAVVVSKADLDWVKQQIGDISQTIPASDICRQAILNWGCESLVNTFEIHFEHVQYFACSALGREQNVPGTPFQCYGVLEPLQWLLTKDRNR
jgi:predicted  nucleic acid-binding Zn-ribbon protein